MGIDVNRFIGDFHLNFVCAICLDVVENPIIVRACEHSYCSSCFQYFLQGRQVADCPACRQPIRASNAKPFGRQLNTIYLGLKLKCTEAKCKVALTVENFQAHDGQCPKKFFICKPCGYEGRSTNNHSCLDWLKDQKERLQHSLTESVKSLAPLIEEIEKLKAEAAVDVKRVSCGKIIAIGLPAYRCRSCQRKEGMVLCTDCFNHGYHEHHDFERILVKQFAYCDCGDSRILKSGLVQCSIHRPLPRDESNYNDLVSRFKN